MADLGYNRGEIFGNGTNTKRVQISYEMAAGYNSNITSTGTVPVGPITLQFASGSAAYQWKETKQKSIYATARPEDGNTGVGE